MCLTDFQAKAGGKRKSELQNVFNFLKITSYAHRGKRTGVEEDTGYDQTD